MAFTYGFYNSINGDRRYDAQQMSAIFDGIITDGVFSSVGGIFATVPGEGMTVVVKSGRAWFDHTWSYNDGAMPLSIQAADVTLKRYDAVVLEVNNTESVRENAIKVIKGTPATNPVKPGLTNTETIHQHPLAYILVDPGVTSITANKIDIRVGQSDCPFSTAILQTVSITDLFNAWDNEFDQWFANVQAQLEGNVVTNLQRQIDERVKIADKATSADLASATPNKWVDAAGLKEKMDVRSIAIGDVVNTFKNPRGNNFFLCNGDLICRNDYPELYNTLVNNKTLSIDNTASKTTNSSSSYNLDSFNRFIITSNGIGAAVIDNVSSVTDFYGIRINSDRPNAIESETRIFDGTNYLIRASAGIATDGHKIIFVRTTRLSSESNYSHRIISISTTETDFGHNTTTNVPVTIDTNSGTASAPGIYNLKYLNGYFILVSALGCWYTIDGITWTKIVMDKTVHDVIYNDGLYIFILSNSTIYTLNKLSDTPIKVGTISWSSDNDAHIKRIAYINGQYFVWKANTYSPVLYSLSYTFSQYSSITMKNTDTNVIDITYHDGYYWFSFKVQSYGCLKRHESIPTQINDSNTIFKNSESYFINFIADSNDTLYVYKINTRDVTESILILYSKFLKLPILSGTNGCVNMIRAY